MAAFCRPNILGPKKPPIKECGSGEVIDIKIIYAYIPKYIHNLMKSCFRIRIKRNKVHGRRVQS